MKVNHSTIEKDFKNHLDFNDNKRILFSGPFGTGKSTFLSEFFETNHTNYISLSLYPINYSVASNEDVFELIKYDLLIELIGKYSKEVQLQKEDFTILLSSQVFILQRMKYMPIITALLGLSEKIGKPAVEIIKALSETITDFNSYKKELEYDEQKIIEQYLNAADNKKGSINEQDDISKLIFDLIERIKNNRDSSGILQSVLVIDDLDRLDPEHVFRLFNVFSAHYDSKTDNNKFGIDKVIFVCDIENIRKVFHHRYGVAVDFSGYINKFYSTNVFLFDNRRFIKEKVQDIILKLYSNSTFLQAYHDFTNPNSRMFIIFEFIVTALIEIRELSLRVLVNPKEVKIPSFYLDDDIGRHPAKQYEFVILITLLSEYYPNVKILHDKLNALRSAKDHSPKQLTWNQKWLETSIINMCLPFLVPREELFSHETKEVNIYSIEYSSVFIHYNYKWHNQVYFGPYFISITRGKELDSDKAFINIYEMLCDTYKKYEGNFSAVL